MRSLLDFFICFVIAVISYWLGTKSVADSGASGLITEDGIKDPNTGIVFSTSDEFSVAKGLNLSGVGTRKKAIINIYSLGLYVSPQLEKQISKSKNVCKTVQDSNQPKALQMKFQMGVGPEKIAQSLAAIEVKTEAGEKAKKKFCDDIMTGIGGKLKRGESMTLEWKGADTIVSTARGKKVVEAKNEELSAGILALYLDSKKSVSPSLRNSLGCK